MRYPTDEPELLARVLRTEERVTIFMLNGFQFQGVIVGHDDEAIIVDVDEDRRWCVYKHAISTIAISKG